MSDKNMKLHLKVWRQKSKDHKGNFENHQVVAEDHMSFLELMDVLNESLIEKKARGCKVLLSGNTGFTLPDMRNLADNITEIDLSSCSLIGKINGLMPSDRTT